MYARSNGQVPIQPVFVNHLGHPFKFYLHESIGDSCAEVVRCITMEGGIIVCRHQQANCILVRPGLPGVRELGSSIPILRFDWVYACGHSRRMVFEGNWAGCFVDNSQHPTPTSYQVPVHHPSYSCPGPTSNTLSYYHSPTYAAPGPVLAQAPSYPAPVYHVPNYVWFVHIITDTVVPTHKEPIYNAPPALGYTTSGSSAPTHCAPPYHEPACRGLGPTTSTHNLPPGNTLVTHAPTFSTVPPQPLPLSSGYPFQPMCREQLEVRSGANPEAIPRVTGRAMPPLSNIPQVETSRISRAVTVPLQVELPAAPKLATPAKSLATRSILPQVEASGVPRVKHSSAYERLWSIEPSLASPRVDSQVVLQIASATSSQVQASSSAPLQPTTSSVPQVGSQATFIVDVLSRSTSQSESFKRSRSPPATASGTQSPTLSSVSRATSPTVIQDQTLMSELESSVGSDQDVCTKGLPLKRKREPSDMGQRTPKKPTLFKYWCQGCGLSFSQGGNAIEHKANPKSSNECRESELVFAANHPHSTKSPADREQNTGASRVTGRSQRSRTPFEDRDLQRAMRNEDVLRWCNSIKQ